VHDLSSDKYREIISKLQDRNVGIQNALAPLLEEYHRVLASNDGISPSVAETLRVLQQALLDVLSLRYDALDAAVRDSVIPFTEINGEGYVSYANDAFTRLVPEARGQAFAPLFEARASDVMQALSLSRSSSLRVDLWVDGHLQQFRAEIGPLRDEAGAKGNYALLLAQRAEEMRQDTAVDGIVRIDMLGTIRFANTKARELFNWPDEQPIGQPLATLFRSDAQHSGDPVSRWIAAGRGLTDTVQLVQHHDRPSPVRVSVMPNFDDQGRQSGLLINFCSLSEETAREKLKSLLSVHADPTTVIREAIRTLRVAVPNDMATFGVYSEDMRYFRALIVDPEPDWEWSTRWFEVAPSAPAWLRSGNTYTNDLRRLIADWAPEQQDDPVFQGVTRKGLNQMLVLPVPDPGGRFRSALSLLSRDRAYGSNDLRILRDLGLEEIMQSADAAMERAQAARVRGLKERLNTAKCARELARRLAEGVVQSFGWEYAAVFRVDRAKNRFVLFEQHDAVKGKLTVDAHYQQGLDQGMLGHAYGCQKLVVLPRVEEDGTEYTDADGLTFTYIRTAGDRQKSAMIVPLHVRGRIELLLDLESTQVNAFVGPDQVLAKSLADDCAQIFDGRWHEAISTSLMDAIDQAAVIVDSVGVIRQVNAAAAPIFGRHLGVPLTALGAGDADRNRLAKALPREQVRVTLALQHGETAPVNIPTLALQQPLNDDYEHCLWLFTNLQEQQWQRDWRYLDETVSEVARHTRAPLLIADGLLRSAAAMLRKPDVAERCVNMLVRAANHLSKADLTFERLSETLTARQAPVEPSTRFDALALLRHEIEVLTAEDAEAVDRSSLPEDSFLLSGWPERLGFAFRSLLGAVLALRGEQPVQVAAEICAKGRLVIRFALPTVPPDFLGPADADPIAEGEKRARQMVALAPEAVASAVEQHGGELILPPPNAESWIYLIHLPLSLETK
jgi:PAS domain-containing protein